MRVWVGPRTNNDAPGADVIADFAFEGNQDIFHENGADDPAPSCKWWYWEDGNCRITHCFEDVPQEGEDPRQRTGDELFIWYDMIRSKCTSWRAGGEFTGAFEFLNVLNDEDEGTIPPSRRTIKRDGGVVEGHLSLEEYREWLNDTATSEEAEHGPVVAKRQDGDESVEIPFRAIGVRNPDAFEQGPRLGNGVGYEWEVTESTSFSVTTSMNLGAAWNIFTASVGFEMSQEDTFTVREGITFNVPCANQGQVTFWPFYDYFETQWSPSGTEGEIWVPVEHGDKKIGGEVAVSCVG